MSATCVLLFVPLSLSVAGSPFIALERILEIATAFLSVRLREIVQLSKLSESGKRVVFAEVASPKSKHVPSARPSHPYQTCNTALRCLEQPHFPHVGLE